MLKWQFVAQSVILERAGLWTAGGEVVKYPIVFALNWCNKNKKNAMIEKLGYITEYITG